MAVQGRVDNNNVPFLLSGNSYVRNGVISQDGARTVDLLQYTVMAFNAATGQWVPFNQLGQLHGVSIPQGIYLGEDILAADLVAGDIENCEILIGGNVTVDVDQVVWDQDLLNADTEIGILITAEAILRTFGIFFESTEAISLHEN